MQNLTDFLNVIFLFHIVSSFLKQKVFLNIYFSIAVSPSGEIISKILFRPPVPSGGQNLFQKLQTLLKFYSTYQKHSEPESDSNLGNWRYTQIN